MSDTDLRDYITLQSKKDGEAAKRMREYFEGVANLAAELAGFPDARVVWGPIRGPSPFVPPPKTPGMRGRKKR